MTTKKRLQQNQVGGLYYSPGRVKRIRQNLVRQEKAWAAKSGPVTVRKIEVENELEV